jgi:hypothetical protein
MKRIAVAVLAIGALWAISCTSVKEATSRTSVKELNERSGRALVREAAAATYYPVSVSPIAPLMKRTLADYRQLVTTAKANHMHFDSDTVLMVIGRLLDQNLIVQHSDTVQFPRINGSYLCERTGMYSEYKLEMIPGTNNIKGVVYQQYPPAKSDVTGAVEADGSVTLGPPRGSGGKTFHYQYKEDGATALLINKGDMYGANFRGTVGPKVDTKWYTYSYSPEVQFPEPNNANGGSYEIGDLSGLQLVDDTHAIGSFAWTVSLNKFGQAVYPFQKPSGTGRVQFGKKPDGSWFVNNWCMTNCMF